MKTNHLKFVLTSALIVGSLDLLFAFLSSWWSSGTSPEGVVRYVASGLIGEKAFCSEFFLAIPIGIVIHYFIALFWTVVFFWAYTKFKWLSKQKIVVGIMFGIFVWLVMNVVILPLSLVPSFEYTWSGAIKGAVILIIAIGLPLAYLKK